MTYRGSFATPGFLACQQNPFLKKLVTQVIECTPIKNGYDLILADTILFPEGGGQPDDKGTISGIPVEKVFTKDGAAVHRVSSPLQIGKDVEVVVDWSRRFDHMQQHSGQHLISSLAFQKWGLETKTWELGETKCNIELDSTSISQQQLIELEEMANEKILMSIPVYASYVDVTKEKELHQDSIFRSSNITSKESTEALGKHLRVITIDGIDENKCCGTHVQNTSQLQCIKILNTEVVRGCTRVYFLAGGRVVKELHKSFKRECDLTRLLSSRPNDFKDRIEKLIFSQRHITKEVKGLKSEIVSFVEAEIRSKVSSNSTKLFYHLHRELGDASYLHGLSKVIDDLSKSILFLLTVGDLQGEGMFLLQGPDDTVSSLSTTVSEFLGGRGGGKKGKYQGKATSLKRLQELVELINQRHS